MYNNIYDLTNTDLLLTPQKKKMKPFNLIEELYPEIPMELDITDRQRNAIENMDLSNRRHVIQALMKQQGLLDTEQPLNNDVLSQAKDYLNPYTAVENTPATDDTAQDEKRRQAEADSVRKAYHHDEDAEDITDTNDLTKKNETTNNNKDTVSDYQLGTLSSKYESLKNPAAIGHDNGGGYSYGCYQIATNTGTMKSYINYLKQNAQYHDYYNALIRAGGYQGAKTKSKEFEQTWINLSQEANFNNSQHLFIIETHLNRLLNSIKEKKLLDIDNRHPVIKDILYSMSVQHYKAPNIVNKALSSLKQKYENDINKITDKMIIEELYKQRAMYVKALPESHHSGDNRITKSEKNNILNKRYPQELKDALEYLD